MYRLRAIIVLILTVSNIKALDIEAHGSEPELVRQAVCFIGPPGQVRAARGYLVTEVKNWKNERSGHTKKYVFYVKK